MKENCTGCQCLASSVRKGKKGTLRRSFIQLCSGCADTGDGYAVSYDFTGRAALPDVLFICPADVLLQLWDLAIREPGAELMQDLTQETRDRLSAEALSSKLN